jgi:hypothetical protein
MPSKNDQTSSQKIPIKIVYPLTCEGAAINPTAMPHTTRPTRIAK